MVEIFPTRAEDLSCSHPINEEENQQINNNKGIVWPLNKQYYTTYPQQTHHLNHIIYDVISRITNWWYNKIYFIIYLFL